MSQIQVNKNNIIQRIQDFKGLDLTKIYTKWPNYIVWNSLNPEDTEAYVKNVLELLVSIEANIDIFDNGLQIWFLQNLDSYIQNTINSYINAWLKHVTIDDITNQHHAFLDQLQNILNTLWGSPYYLLLKGFNSFESTPITLKESVLEAQVELWKFIESKKDITDAISWAKSWLDNRRKMEEEVVKKQAWEYDSRATEHKTHNEAVFWSISTKLSGSWWWLFSAFIFSIITAVVTYSFYDSAKNSLDISIGSAILHIATVIVPAYLTVFCSTQFLFHKKMYESYKFKYASLLTMNYLLEFHKNDSSKTEKILNKWLDVLFSEPSIKEDSWKIDKTMATELIKLATSKW